MKQKDHQDIIKQMADRLREHTVPYQEGAWERFKQVEKKKPKYLMLWPYLSVAAAILIAFVLFLKPEQSVPLVNELVEQNITDEHNEVNSIKEEENKVVDEKSNLLASSPNEKVEIQSHLIKQIVVASDAVIENDNLDVNGFPIAKESPIIKEMIAFKDKEKEIQENTAIKKVIAEPSSIVSVQEEKKAPIDYLAVLSTLKEDNGFIEDKDIDKKWSVGLDVSPNISSNNQLNMGGGIAFAYSVSSKVSISSGVSYLRLDVDRMPEISSQMSSAPYPSPSEGAPVAGFLSGKSQVRTLNKIEANLIGVDIPLAINYHLNKNLYASVGVSVFNVLNEDRTNQFKSQEVSVLYSDDQKLTPEPVIHTFYSTEKALDKVYEGKGLSGFYNFSIGYLIPVSKKMGLSVEPFYKIPMSTMDANDMNLSNGGIKISTRF